jgi:predicted RND superfamily exporter protein
MSSELKGALKGGLVVGFAALLAMVLMILAVDLRDPRWVMLAITPVLVGGLVTFGILCWFDVGFTVLLVIVVPLLIGLGVDDGIHVVHRMLEDPGLAPEQAAESVGRAIVMTTGTTCASFGVLLFSNHPGMESMAYTMLLGLPLCLLGSMTLIPAMAVLLGLREPAPRA